MNSFFFFFFQQKTIYVCLTYFSSNYPIQIWKGKLRKGLLDSTLNPNLDRNRYNEVQWDQAKCLHTVSKASNRD